MKIYTTYLGKGEGWALHRGYKLFWAKTVIPEIACEVSTIDEAIELLSEWWADFGDRHYNPDAYSGLIEGVSIR